MQEMQQSSTYVFVHSREKRVSIVEWKILNHIRRVLNSIVVTVRLIQTFLTFIPELVRPAHDTGCGVLPAKNIPPTIPYFNSFHTLGRTSVESYTQALQLQLQFPFLIHLALCQYLLQIQVTVYRWWMAQCAYTKICE